MKIRHTPKALVISSHKTITKSPGFKKWRKLKGVNCAGSRGAWPFVKDIINDFLGDRGVLIEGRIVQEGCDGIIYDSNDDEGSSEYEWDPIDDLVLSLNEDVSIYQILEEYNSSLPDYKTDIYVIEGG